ncbi:MAG TPA: DipZ protein [Solirubrobacteraceae bacterium]|nr:DipZ protein [Solirubrobacteraceae bacterium]
MRAPPNRIPAPAFLTHLRWVNVKSLRIERQLGRPVLVEFWDFCRPNSVRTLPYLKAWYERYGPAGVGAGGARGGGGGDGVGRDRDGAGGLQVVGIHSPGFPPGRDRATAEAAVARLGIAYPVLLDPDLEMWQEYENRGWPARYLFDPRGSLFDYHYGEGGYRETELAIQELLGMQREPLAPVRPEDDPQALLAPQTEDQPGAYSGPYEAGGVWAVLAGAGTVRVNGAELAVTHPGAYPLVEHDRHTAGVLELEIGEGVECLATCFTPGVA